MIRLNQTGRTVATVILAVVVFVIGWLVFVPLIASIDHLIK